MKRVALGVGVVVAAVLARPALAYDAPTPPPATRPVLARLAVPGNADAHYVEPNDAEPRPLLLILHARARDPEEDCKKWIEVASPFGWVLCPSGPVANNDTQRSWGKLDEAKKTVDAAVGALRAKFGARIKPAGNAIIGFSEGALVAQVVGISEPDKWSRWLILAGSDKYWGDKGLEWLQAQRRKIAKVVMLTGEHDPIRENTLRAGAWVRAAHIPVRVIIRKGLGHDVPADRMIANYEPSLKWLFDVK
jgi:predicted esterase